MHAVLKTLNDFYNKTYVLTIADAHSRRKLFAQRFQGMDYTFFYGIDKKKISVAELIDKKIYSEELTRKNHRYSKPMMAGEIACAWSHKKIYADMLQHGYSRILIFEDDALPDPDAIAKIPEVLSEIPPNCDLLFWGWSKNGQKKLAGTVKQNWYHLQHRLGLLKWNNLMIRNLFAQPYSKNLKTAGFHDFTYAYAITRRGAQKLLEMQTPIQYVADNLLAYACTQQVITGYIVYPPVFLHGPLPVGTAGDSYIR